MGAPFASPTDLADYLQQEVGRPQASLALETTSNAIRDFCGWSITRETVTATVDGGYRQSIWLPTLLLTAVQSVTEDGTTLVGDRDYTWTSTGRLIRNGRWSSNARSVTVTYVHGYSVPPGAVKQACLAAASRSVSNPQSLRSKTTGPFSWTAAGAAGDLGPGLAEIELATLARFRILPGPA